MQRNTVLFTVTIASILWIGTAIHATSAKADIEPIDASVHIGVPPQPTSYIVQNGDYLVSIADQSNISWPSIYQANSTITNPDLIFPSQTISIPTVDIPLTRNLPATSLTIPADYQPQPTSPTALTLNRAGRSGASLVAAGTPGIGNALSLVGLPYVYGGTSPAGFDCSGLVQYIAASRGISLPRTVMQQYNATARIGKADLQPGDLVFFNDHHVGMYLGSNQVIHATNPAQGVRIDSLDTAIAYNGYMGAGRL